MTFWLRATALALTVAAAGCATTRSAVDVELAPFTNQTGDAAFDWVGVGARHVMARRLSGAHAVRTTLPTDRDGQVDAAWVAWDRVAAPDVVLAAARERGLHAVVFGLVSRAGAAAWQLELIARRPTDGEVVWRRALRGDDPAALAAGTPEAARALLAALGVASSPEERGRLAAPSVATGDAYRMHAQVLTAWTWGDALPDENLSIDADGELEHDEAASIPKKGGWPDDDGAEAGPLERRMRHVVTLDPDYADAWITLGWLAARDGRDDEALAAFDRALALAPEDVHGHLARGVLLHGRRQWEAASGELSRVFAASPRVDLHRTALARALAAHGSALVEALPAGPGLDDDGRARAAAAIVALERARDLVGELPRLQRDVGIGLARGHIALGDPAAATVALRIARRRVEEGDDPPDHETLRDFARAELSIARAAGDALPPGFADAALPDTLPVDHAELERALVSDANATTARDCTGFTWLHEAADLGVNGHIDALIDAGAGVDARSVRRETPLHRAAFRGHPGAVARLLDAGADVDARDVWNRSPLHRAAATGHREVARHLIARGASVSARDLDMRAPLHIAAFHGRGELVALLLRRGARATMRDQRGQRPLHIAALRGHADVARRLLSGGADPSARDGDGETPLHLAASGGHLDVIHVLVASGADIEVEDLDGYTPLHRAALAGRTGVVRSLVTAGADASRRSNAAAGAEGHHTTALHLAARRGHPGTVAALVELVGDVDLVDSAGNTALHVAAEHGRAAVVRRLVGLGAGVASKNDKGNGAIDIAAAQGHVAVVALLADALVAAASDHGPAETLGQAIISAVPGSRAVEVIKLLHAKGASLASHRDGQTALHDAASRDLAPVAALLLSLGADPNPRSESRAETPLHVAAQTWRAEVIPVLVAAGASIDARDADDQTPLHLAIRAGRDDTAAALIAAGADVNAEAGGRRPVHLALQRQDRALLDRLIAAGARKDIFVAAWLGDERAVRRELKRDRTLARAVDAAGFGAIHYAAMGGHGPIIRLLIRYGADVEMEAGRRLRQDGVAVEEAKGRLTALRLAAQSGDGAAFDLLVKLGADLTVLETGAGVVATEPTAKPDPMQIEDKHKWHPDTEELPSEEGGDYIFGGGSHSPSRGGLQIRERSISTDVLTRHQLDGTSDSHGSMAGYEAQLRVCVARDDYPGAERHARELLDGRLTHDGADAAVTALARHNLGRVLHYRARYGEARRHLDTAFARLAPTAGASASDGQTWVFSAVVENLGNLDAIQGDYDRAEARFVRVLELRTPLKDIGLLALTHGRLGALYTETGRYADAEKHLLKAFKLRREQYESDPHPQLASALNNLAVLWDLLGEHARAARGWRTQLLILERVQTVETLQLAIAHFNVAQVALREDKLDEALLHLTRADELMKRQQRGRQYAQGRIALGLGLALARLGKTEDAEAAYARALAATTRDHGEVHGFVARVYRRIGELKATQGELDAASEALTQALAIADQAGVPEELWQVQLALCRVLVAQGERKAAVFFGKQALNTLQGLRKHVAALGEARARSYVDDRVGAYRTVADVLLDLGRLPEATAVLGMLKDEELRSFATRSQRARDHADARAELVPSEVAWAERYEQVRDDLVAKGARYRALVDKKRRDRTLSAEERVEKAALLKDITVGRKAFAAYLKELKATIRAMPAARSADIDAKNLAKVKSMRGTLREMGHGAVLVHYLVTPKKLRILLTTPEVQVAREVDIDDKQLNRSVQQFREVLVNPRADPVAAAGELYDLLLGPIVDDLVHAKATTLMISLDGSLRYLPIAALHDGERYLVERFRLALFSMAAADKIAVQRGAPWEVAALGLSKKHPGFDALPAVPKELDDIVRTSDADRTGVLPGVVRLDGEFTEEALIEAIEAPHQAIHVASHFVFKPGTAADSYLLLGDGKKLSLQAIDETLSFDEVDLLALSACNTAMGAGEGREVEGFAAVALGMGAKAVLATLWQVGDASTGALMQAMYRIHSGDPALTKADALRRAQLTLLRGTAELSDADLEPMGAGDIESGDALPRSGKLSHPYYWAPFVLMGNWL